MVSLRCRSFSVRASDRRARLGVGGRRTGTGHGTLERAQVLHAERQRQDPPRLTPWYWPIPICGWLSGEVTGGAAVQRFLMQGGAVKQLSDPHPINEDSNCRGCGTEGRKCVLRVLTADKPAAELAGFELAHWQAILALTRVEFRLRAKMAHIYDKPDKEENGAVGAEGSHDQGHTSPSTPPKPPALALSDQTAVDRHGTLRKRYRSAWARGMGRSSSPSTGE